MPDVIDLADPSSAAPRPGPAAPPPRVLLAAATAAAADAALAQLRREGSAAGRGCTFAAVRDRLAAGAEDVLALRVTGPAEVEEARHLARELFLRRWPGAVVLLADEDAAGRAVLDLEAHVTQLLFWPRDLAEFTRLLRHRPGRPADPAVTAFPEGTTAGRIARRLAGWTPSLLPHVEKLALAAEHDVTVLITGETGTGKTFLARLIHECSPRRAERFLHVACGAVSPTLVESEFFGHVKGAFTGADREKPGKFAAAGHGSLLLDEVDALALEQQANLLRVVETGEYEPVGGTETLRSHCRLIVASNRDLKDEVAQGRFREDLYYRFNVMAFRLPPLRERRQDVPSLVRGMAARFTTKFRKDLDDVSPEAMALLQAYPWPGNVRELENALQSAVLVSSGPTLLPAHLPEGIQRATAHPGPARPAKVDTLTHNREVIERSVILRALANHGNSRAKAASELGISRVTLYKKMKKYGLMRPTRQAG